MTVSSAEKGYRPAKQARSKRTEQRFIEAALDAFLVKGFSATRVSDIIASSGCSTGSFYHRFADKRDLFDLMLERYCDHMLADIRSLDLSRATHGTVRNLLYFYLNRSQVFVRENMGFYRAAHEISAQDPAVWDTLKDLSVQIGEQFILAAPEYADDIRAENKEQAMVHAVQLIITMVVHTALGSGPLFPSDIDGLSDVILRAAMGVLNEPSDL